MSPKFFRSIICRVLKLKKNILKKEKEKAKEKAKQYSWAKGAESRKQRKQNLQKRKLRKQKTWQY